MPRSSTCQRADLPTLLLHWGIVAALLASVSTGGRIANLGDGSRLWRWMDALLLQGNVVRWHLSSALALVALVAAYLAFLTKTGLAARLRLQPGCLRASDRRVRWQALNRLVYWSALGLLSGSTITGSLMYFAPGLLPTAAVARSHELLSWGFVAYAGLHVVAQVALGGPGQLLKMFSARLACGTGAVFGLATGVTVAAIAYVVDNGSLDTLWVARAKAVPKLDGDPSDAEWARGPEVVVHTHGGVGLGGGAVAVHVRALHDGRRAFMLFRWPDATRSQKHVPLVKAGTGWEVLHSNYFNNDEKYYYEDKFAVMLADSPIVGGNTVRLGPRPLGDKPGPSNGLGLHGTTDGSLADVWHWKSVRSGAVHQFDDNYFGPPMEPRSGRYTGGYGQDPALGGGFEQNFERDAGAATVRVRYLPLDLAAQQARMKGFNPDIDVSDEGEFAMHRGEVVPYSAESDSAIPEGTVIPSVVYDGPFVGDRGDVTARARWRDGWWTLEASRLLETGSDYDRPIADGMFMWVAVFDHNQVRHTRHARPLRIRLQ